jgi:putative spermidine/putrescine transport system ATP-binding protein
VAHLEIRNVRRTFGEVHAISDVSLRVGRGEFVSLLGPSGSGKTTTLRIVAGFERPDDGAVLLDGADITQLPPQRRHMGMVFQSYALFPNMTAAQNVAFGLRIRREPTDRVRARVEELLSLVGLGQKAGRYPHQLSGGEQQRVALARALAPKPDVLLLDEPLSALDARIRVALRGEIRRIQRSLRITTLYVTHDQEEALAVSDRIVVFNQGRIEQDGTPRDVYERPATPFVAEFVGTTNRLLGVVDDPITGTCRIGDQRVYFDALPDHVAAGDTVEIRVRPERVGLGPDPSGTSRPLEGRVADVVYLGGHTLVQVRVADQDIWMDRAQQSGAPELVPGVAVRVYLPSRAVVTRRTGADAPAAETAGV